MKQKFTSVELNKNWQTICCAGLYLIAYSEAADSIPSTQY